MRGREPTASPITYGWGPRTTTRSPVSSLSQRVERVVLQAALAVEDDDDGERGPVLDLQRPR